MVYPLELFEYGLQLISNRYESKHVLLNSFFLLTYCHGDWLADIYTFLSRYHDARLSDQQMALLQYQRENIHYLSEEVHGSFMQNS